MKKKNNLVWIDLEMTGLDLAKEGIIEIATIITDGELHILAEGPNLIIHQPERLLAKMDRWNRRQHAKSGLAEQVRKSKVSVAKAEKLTLDFVKRYCLPRKSPLCGNAVHHDRSFIAKYMPRLNRYLHYRHIDVSTLKTLVKLWHPKEKRPPKKKDSHRALSDIRESIEELRFYQKYYFK